MNAVEIEEAVSKLVEAAFDAAEFPYAFLEAFGNKDATIRRLRSTGKNTTNKTDVDGDDIVAVLQRNNIHVASLPHGIGRETDLVDETMTRLVESPATTKHKVKFVLVTDGRVVHAEKLGSDEPPLVCEFEKLDDHFGYFLELAGISTVRQIRENAFDIKATGRLNRLYVELLRNNPDWDGDQRREELNHFFARLIFCFFAEDTGIFHGNDLFTDTVRQMSESSGENTHWVLAELFRAMDIRMKDRDAADLRPFAGQFPYVNGGLFGGGTSEGDVPKFTQIARSYLLHIGSLDWTRINPDIFGSMIQAVADDEERGALGMHYTSVPNILKVLNPLFLDDLHDKLKEAGTNARKLLNLRKRLARIRVFDPACGSGNFLVIAYKQMRAIEAEINVLRGEPERASDIPLTNFRGIELRHFAVEVARLALIIAEYQCDELYRGQRLALAEFLPLNKDNWITHGNALKLDWLKVCPPTGTGGIKLTEDDLFQTPLDQPEIDFENEGGETYVCGNPPYLGSQWRTKAQQEEMSRVFSAETKTYKDLDYVAAWYLLAAKYCAANNAACALVATKTICQGIQVAMLWPLIFRRQLHITFAHRPFEWANLAANKAGVTCVIVGLAKQKNGACQIFDDGEIKLAENIGPYLLDMPNIIVEKRKGRSDGLPVVDYGNKPTDGGNLILHSMDEVENASCESKQFLRKYVGSAEFVRSTARHCYWIEESDKPAAYAIPGLRTRFDRVHTLRSESKGKQANDNASTPHRFVYAPHQPGMAIVIPRVTSHNRPYLPCGLVDESTIVADTAAVAYGAPVWTLALIASRLHQQWIATVCVRLRTDYRYSNTLGWNTFPVPSLTDQNKADLTRCAEDILLAREAHWPATIAELYDPDKMPADLRAAHDRNDETLERIYIGRRFKNDTERLETLFAMYTEMTSKKAKA